MLKGKNVLLGVTGGIACYKALDIVSKLKKIGANVDVVMTENATKLVAPKSFEVLSQNVCVVDTFQTIKTYEVEHISLAKKADLVLIAPATYNFVGKLASGIADDMLTTTVTACKCPILIAPAMNTNMYENPIFLKNVEYLSSLGYHFINAQCGRLACGDVGVGKLPDTSEIIEYVVNILCPKQDMKGKTILVTGGGTSEPIDSVRVMTNRSSGKMAVSICENALLRGANVIFVAGNVSVPIPHGVKLIKVDTTQKMCDIVMANMNGVDYFVMAAAPCDYRPKEFSFEKIKSDKLTIEFVKNPDIAMSVGEKKGNSKLVVFSAETSNLIENAKAKMHKKNADMVVANDVTKAGAGFNVDTNIVSIIDKNDIVTEYDVMTKSEVAKVIIDKMLTL